MCNPTQQVRSELQHCNLVRSVLSVCSVRGELSIVFVSVAAVGGGEQLHIVGGGVATTTIVTGGGEE